MLWWMVMASFVILMDLFHLPLQLLSQWRNECQSRTYRMEPTRSVTLQRPDWCNLASSSTTRVSCSQCRSDLGHPCCDLCKTESWPYQTTARSVKGLEERDQVYRCVPSRWNNPIWSTGYSWQAYGPWRSDRCYSCLSAWWIQIGDWWSWRSWHSSFNNWNSWEVAQSWGQASLDYDSNTDTFSCLSKHGATQESASTKQRLQESRQQQHQRWLLQLSAQAEQQHEMATTEYSRIVAQDLILENVKSVESKVMAPRDVHKFRAFRQLLKTLPSHHGSRVQMLQQPVPLWSILGY